MSPVAWQQTPALAQAQRTPVVLERIEHKYPVPLSMVGEITDFVRPYCSPDTYSQASDDGFYLINSLYFDTPAYHFLMQRINRAENRFNMRIRSYGTDPRPPFFLEIKQRKGDVVRKFRATHFDDDIEALLASSVDAQGRSPKEAANRGLFIRTAARYNAAPVVLVQYRRKALFSNVDEYARITFDTDLRFMAPRGFALSASEDEMRSCGLPGAPGGEAIMEVKCSATNVPLWMVDTVRAFNLERRGFSKYSVCVKPLVSGDRDRGPLGQRSALMADL